MAGTITGKHILWDLAISVNGVDLSSRVESASFLELGLNTHDGASMGEIQDYVIAGTKTISDPQITFYQDFDTAKVYATCYTLWDNRTTFDLVGNASSGANSATNPEWTLPCIILKMPVMVGNRRDRHMAPTTFKIAGTATVAIA